MRRTLFNYFCLSLLLKNLNLKNCVADFVLEKKLKASWHFPKSTIKITDLCNKKFQWKFMLNCPLKISLNRNSSPILDLPHNVSTLHLVVAGAMALLQRQVVHLFDGADVSARACSRNSIGC